MSSEYLKLCPKCQNIMMIEKSESDDTKYPCILCGDDEAITVSTVITSLQKSTTIDSRVNPRQQHEITSALNQITYRKCKQKKCCCQLRFLTDRHAKPL